MWVLHVPRGVPPDAARQRRAARVPPGFTVYDDTDSRRRDRAGHARPGPRPARLPPRTVAAAISAAKSQLLDVAAYAAAASAADPYERAHRDVYGEYEQRLRRCQRDGLRRPARQHGAPAADVPRRARALPAAGSATCWSTSTRTRTSPRTRSCGCSPTSTATSRWSATRTSRSTGSAPRTSATSWSSRRTSPTPRSCCSSRTSGSTQTILDAANAIIANNPRDAPQGPVRPRATRASGSRGTAANDEPTRPRGSPRRSGGSASRRASRWGDVAIFYRTNAQSRVLEDELVRADIPYKVVGGHPVLRPPRGQGRARVPAAVREPGRRGRGAPDRERPEARHRRDVGDAAGRVRRRRRDELRRGDRPRRGGRAHRQGAARRARAARAARDALAVRDDVEPGAARSRRSSSAPATGRCSRPRAPTRRGHAGRTSPSSSERGRGVRDARGRSWSAWRSSPTATSSTPPAAACRS